MAKMPQQKPGKSEQAVQTPNEFVWAVKHSLLDIPIFVRDLAASAENTQANVYITQEQDALKHDWQIYGWQWLNPPYANIKPWVAKCVGESAMGAKIAVLVPAAVGTNWWRDHVHGQAQVYFIQPRLTFVGHKNPYPKDLALLLYRPNIRGGYNLWNWKA